MPRRIFFISLAGLAVLALFQLWLAVPSTEAVRLRNAFLIERGVPADFAWKPADRPADFRWESQAASPAFIERARSALKGETRAFEGALLLSSDLLRNARDGGPIQSDLEQTYKRITEDGSGYCADFTDVFLALAHAAGIPARQWAFSFDGFGGYGHAFVEVFDAARGQWLMIDLFNNFYPVTASGAPMSALEFRADLSDNAPVRMQRISNARLGFPIAAKAIDYYRRGTREWYLWWGNDVFTYDRLPAVRAASVLGRSAEELTAIATGSFPHFRVLDSTGNADLIDRMGRLRQLLLVNLALGVALLALAIGSGVAWYRSARQGPRTTRALPATGAAAHATPRTLHLALIGPLPPPAGGMANQCAQLAACLQAEGIDAEVVRTNAPYRPAWVTRLRGVRAFFRLVPYSHDLWRVAGRSDLVHLFANSGWAWHLLGAPAIWIARLRGTPIIVNYRGGDAAAFLARSARWVLPSLRAADLVVVPSPFLREVFAKYGIEAEIVPNIIDLKRFRPRDPQPCDRPSILVARNLEPIYGIDTALRAFAIVRGQIPGARMIVAGSGPERDGLVELARALKISDAVTFAGRVDNAAMPAYYDRVDVALNSSTVDNMPISLLEAYASGVPVVTTNVGGIPFIARDGDTALLVPPRDEEAMASALLRVLLDRSLHERIRANALQYVTRFAWPSVREQWFSCYARLSTMPLRATA